MLYQAGNTIRLRVFPADENGFRLGSEKTSHQHVFMMIFACAVLPPLFCLTMAKSDDRQADGIILHEKPATNWEKEALPLGNGRLGCMVFGGVEEERITTATSTCR